MTGISKRPRLGGARVTVMGLGSFGGGVGAVRFLHERGANVTVTDLRTEEQLADSLGELAGIGSIQFHLGGHRERDFTDADLVVVNPAVPPGNPFVAAAHSANVPVATEIGLFWQWNRGRVIAVTGSNGKSTTTAMIHNMLRSAGLRCWLGGNIGVSLLPRVDEIEATDWVVLELSSFQLEYLDRLQASPDVAVVTNFSPNHLDWHGTVDNYRRAKQSIVRWQRPDQVTVANDDDRDVAGWATRARRFWFGRDDNGAEGAFGTRDRIVIRSADARHAVPLGDWLRLPGRHNLDNALAAAAATSAVGVDVEAIRLGLETYTPLPHRLQLVAEIAGRKFYNDSLATTPESAIAAIDAFDAPIVLMAGGYDKQVDLSEFANRIADRVHSVALLGQTAGELARLIAKHPNGQRIHSRAFSGFEAAFAWSANQSQPGDVVLLSPGCASYDWFANFTKRGQRFTELAQNWQPNRIDRQSIEGQGLELGSALRSRVV